MDYQVIKDLLITHIQANPTHQRFIYIIQGVLEYYNNPPELIKRLKTQARTLYKPLVRKEVLDLISDIQQLLEVKA